MTSGNVLATYEKLPEEDELEIKETMIYGSGRIGIACPDNFSSGCRHDFVKLDPDKGYISGDEYRNEYEGKDYELLPAASMTLTQGFVFDAAETNTFEISTVDAAEILGASQYELTDHLGNVRIAVVNEPTSITFTTNLENAEGGGFENVSETRHQDVNFNHTPGGSYSSWLNHAQNGKTLGPAISLMVSPGDVVKMSAYGMYLEEVGENTGVVNTLIAALAGSFKGVPGLEATEIANYFAQLPEALTGAGMEATGSAPKAYLKYIVFDKNFEPFDAGNITTADTDFRMLGDSGPNAWEKLEMEVSITKNGYIYIYVANESTADVNVHFDDVEVQLIESPATSGNDYYPFGLAMEGRSWSSEPYRFGYQGQFSEYDDETGWNHFEFRNWDPTIGRWMATDPAGQYWSPYLGMGNNPVIGVDPDGAYSRAGAWWRSLMHPGSEVIPVGESGKEFAVLFNRWESDGAGGKVLAYYSFDEGNIVFGMDGLGFEVGGDFHLRAGFTNSKDIGAGGAEIDMGSVTLFRFSPHFAYESGKGWGNSTWGLNWLGKDDKVTINIGGRGEYGGDVKFGQTYQYDLNTGKMTLVESYMGGGTPFTEIKYVHNHVHNAGKLYSGFQEEVVLTPSMKSIPIGGGLTITPTLGGNAQMTISNMK